MPTSSRGVAHVNPVWPRAACSRASAVHLCALTCGRRRAPGSAAVIVSRLCVSARASTTSAGVGSSATRGMRASMARVRPIPAEARPPTDRDWHTDELPATPQRDFLIPADALGRGAGRAARRSGADLGIDARRVQAADRPLPALAGRARRRGRRALHGDRVRRPRRALHVPLVSRRVGRGRGPGRTRRTRGSARGRRRCVTHPTPDNPFAAADVGSACTRAAGRTTTRARSDASSTMRRRDRASTRGLDIACGTGMSTVALAEHADAVVGVDVSPEMLRAAHSGAPASHYMFARRGALAVPERRLRRGDVLLRHPLVRPGPLLRRTASRVARPDGWVGLYDHYFIGEMVDVPEFARMDRAPRSSGIRCRRATSRSAIRARELPAGFEKVGDELFADDIEMTHGAVRRLPAHDQQLRRGRRGGNAASRAPKLDPRDRPRRFFAGHARADGPLPRLDSLAVRRSSVRLTVGVIAPRILTPRPTTTEVRT